MPQEARKREEGTRREEGEEVVTLNDAMVKIIKLQVSLFVALPDGQNPSSVCAYHDQMRQNAQHMCTSRSDEAELSTHVYITIK